LWLTVAIEITKDKLPSSRKVYEAVAKRLLMAKDKEKEKEKDGDKRRKLQKVIELLGID
jgi:hypothetical protein